MQVTEIVISAGRTFNHPFEDYSNLRPNVTLKATVTEADDFEQCVKNLQAKAESMVQDHKVALLQAIHDHQQLMLQEREIKTLESMIKTSQEKLEHIRSQADTKQLEIGE